MNENTKEETKSRDWFPQINYDYETHDKDGNKISDLTKEEWKKSVIERVFNEVGEEGYCALIFHDLDILEDGSPKPLHAHILIHFKNPRSQSGVMKSLGITREANCNRVKARSSAARYLTHISSQALNTDKHIYHAEDVITKNCDYRELVKQTSAKKSEQRDINEFIGLLSSEIQNGLLQVNGAKTEILASFGTADGQKIWRTYRDGFGKDFKEYLSDKADRYTKHGRHLENFYISGKGGTGKSRLAKALALYYADDAPIHTAAAHGKNKTFDLVSTYRGQSITLLNEASANSFAFREFCAIFDPYEYAPVNSRNADKPWLAEKMFMTTTDDFSFFVKTVAETADDKNKSKTADNIYQVTRRFKYIISGTKIKGSKSKFELSEFDEASRSFKSIGSFICEDVITQINQTAQEIAKFIEKKPLSNLSPKTSDNDLKNE